MRSSIAVLSLVFLLNAVDLSPGVGFTPLIPLHPKIVNLPPAMPGGGFSLTNLFDGNLKSEYASRDEGTNTVVELDFGAVVRIAAIRHVDRNDRATVAESRLDVFGEDEKLVSSVPITHVNQRQGVTSVILPEPISGKTIQWHVTKLGDKGLFSVGGAELTFLTSENNDPTPKRDTVEARILPFVNRADQQTLKVAVQHPYAESAKATIIIPDHEPQAIDLKWGANEFEWELTQVKAQTTRQVTLQFQNETISRVSLTQSPVRQMTIYILPHSHTDIGYTEIQSAVEKKQVKNVLDGIAAAQKTASYPEGARFIWNVEAAWAVDLFLQRKSDAERAMFFEAVKKGQVALNGMYLNELTGLCRPEELVRLFRFATQVSEKTGVPIDSAMISDVPGYTWGVVPAMSQAGIRYLSAAPNYFDRIGNILQEWENKPFYWEGPDGKSKVLVWIPFWGYAMSHIYHDLSPKLIDDFYAGLEKRKYPYDIAYVRWAGHGDNAVPDPAICDFVRDWNAKYEWPKFVISGVSQAFRALENRYGKEIPTMRGDWSPYWEDGAGSSALQTAQNRQSSERLTQAATIFALRTSATYPVNEFENAWRNVLLYSEHTWGAWCSISEPERKDTVEQWAVKKAYADNADAQSHDLLKQALGGSPSEASGEVEILNTLSWNRTELITLSRELSANGDRVVDAKGKAAWSQRLSTGELVFRAADVPALSPKRFKVGKGATVEPPNPARASGAILENGLIRLRVDEKTGSIVELTARGIDSNLVDTTKEGGLNDYQYLIGDDITQVRGNGPVKITVGESGPLVASLIIESAAPGCKSLRRELRLVAGEDSVLIINTVDKERLATKSYYAKEGKESLNFAFPFQVPGGDLLFDVPFGVVRPEQDQLPSACKNWLTVGRWVDVANKDYGVTWATLDAPLIEPGYLSATLLNSQTNPDVWRKRIEKTQKFYSWAMNNHWGTNYRAYQDGPTVFRFVLRPHRRKADPAAATRFSTGFTQPLLVTASSGAPDAKPLLSLDSTGVVITGLKPSDDGKGVIVRLFEASGKAQNIRLKWNGRQPKAVAVSDIAEKVRQKITGKISLPAYGLVTVRADF